MHELFDQPGCAKIHLQELFQDGVSFQEIDNIFYDEFKESSERDDENGLLVCHVPVAAKHLIHYTYLHHKLTHGFVLFTAYLLSGNSQVLPRRAQGVDREMMRIAHLSAMHRVKQAVGQYRCL